MQHLHTPSFSRFSLTLLLYGLLGAGLERVSFAADLTASSAEPSVFFDDTDTAPNPDWRILADQSWQAQPALQKTCSGTVLNTTAIRCQYC